jgi:hypothetical protein
MVAAQKQLPSEILLIKKVLKSNSVTLMSYGKRNVSLSQRSMEKTG